MSTRTPEQRAARTRMAVQVTGIGLLALIVGPLFFTILHGLGVIAALFLASAVFTTVWKFIPYLGMVVGNWRLKAIKHEASKNPIETLQNQFADKTRALGVFWDQIKIFNSKVLTFEDTVKQYQAEGLDDAQNYVVQLQKMKRLLELRVEKYKKSKAALEEFEVTIQQTDRKWKMALAAQEMNHAAGEIDGDAFDNICIETAMTSVQDRLNESFSELEMALIEEDKPKSLNAPVVELVISAPEKAKVRA